MESSTCKVRRKSQRKARPVIGVLIEEVQGYWGNVMTGAFDCARDHDVNLIVFSGGTLCDIRQNFQAQRNIIYELVTGETLDGLVFTSGLGNYLSPEMLETFYQRYADLPKISIGRKMAEFPSIVVENKRSFHDAITHLIVDHGYQRIGFIKGPENSPMGLTRHQSYLETLTQYGLTYDGTLVMSGDYSWPSGIEAIRVLLDERGLRPFHDIEAVVAANDYMALGALEELQARGIQVPGEIALVGFDDVIESRYVFPALTTVRSPTHKMAYQATEILLQQIEGEEVPLVTTLETELVIRQSCGCPSQRLLQVWREDGKEIPPENVASKPFEPLTTKQYTQVLAALENVILRVSLGTDIASAARLLDALLQELQEIATDTFILTLNGIVTQKTVTYDDINGWQEVISELWHQILPYVRGTNRLSQVKELWQQARLLMADMTQQVEMQKRVQKINQNQVLWEISQTLLATFDTKQLLEILATGLPRLRISRGYVVMYENPRPYTYPQPAPEWSHVMLAYDEADRSHSKWTDVEAKGQRFRSRELLPKEFGFWKKQYRIILVPLYFRDHQIGFVLFEVGPREGKVYEVLRGQISSALQGALLLGELRKHQDHLGELVEERTGELSIANEQLRREIADRKRAEKTLAEERNLLHTIINTLPDYLFVKDKQTRFLLLNQAAVRAMGNGTLQDYIGKTDFDLFPRKFVEQYYADDLKVIQDGEAILNKEEPSIYLETGETRWLTTSKVPFHDQQGDIIGLVGISRDITQRKKMEEELCKHRDHLEELIKERTTELTTANEQLHQAKEMAEEAQRRSLEAKEAAEAAQRASETANQAKSDFLARMSHELRTPLNGILGYTQILKRDAGLASKHREEIDIIHDSGEHLLMMVNDMLDLARIEARKINLEAAAFDLPACIHSVINMIHVRAKQKGLVFETEIPPDLPAVVQGDEKRLCQILLNLLGNAIKFTEQGKVVLRIVNSELQNEPTPPPSQEGKFEIRNLKFEIQDTGIGIPSEHLEKIFDAFHRVHDSRVRTEGTGLGLAISQQLVRLMGGELQVRSTIGQGSNFWFDLALPVVEHSSLKHGDQPIHQQEIVGFKGRSRTILIADDNAINRAVVKKMVMSLGFEVIEAADGREVLDTLASKHPDLILMDLRMPEIDGFETTRQIRKQEAQKSTTVDKSTIPLTPLRTGSNQQSTIIIALSASVFDQTRQESFDVGCDDFLPKPVHTDDLLEKLHKHLHLEWIYAEIQEPEDTAHAQEERSLIPLPSEALTELYDLLMLGDVNRLQARARQIGESDGQYAPFVAKLCQLANEYRVEELGILLEQSMEGNV